jgi:hypothetical protein
MLPDVAATVSIIGKLNSPYLREPAASMNWRLVSGLLRISAWCYHRWICRFALAAGAGDTMLAYLIGKMVVRC